MAQANRAGQLGNASVRRAESFAVRRWLAAGAASVGMGAALLGLSLTDAQIGVAAAESPDTSSSVSASDSASDSNPDSDTDSNEVSSDTGTEDGDTATARAYVDALIMAPDNASGVDAVGFYDDELVRTDTGWRIRRRRFTTVLMRTVHPG